MYEEHSQGFIRSITWGDKKALREKAIAKAMEVHGYDKDLATKLIDCRTCIANINEIPDAVVTEFHTYLFKTINELTEL